MEHGVGQGRVALQPELLEIDAVRRLGKHMGEARLADARFALDQEGVAILG